MRTYADFIARTWNENILHSVMLELTYRCDLACVYCYNDKAARGTPLSAAEYAALLAELASLQVMHLVLTGGEPLRHPDFFLIGGEARRLGFVIRIKSNGHSLSPATVARLRREIDPFVVDLSVHGATAATHDRQTRVPGSFQRLVTNVGLLREAGVRVKLNCTLTAWNEGEIEAIFALADSLQVPLSVNPTVSPRDDGDRTPLELAPSDEGLRRFYRFLAQRQRDREGEPALALPAEDGMPPVPVSKHCGAGSSSLTVDPFGNVYPCVQWRRPLGNLRERSIGEIWRSSAALRTVREITVQARATVAAALPEPAGVHFCPGLAEQLTGSPLAVYPQAARLARLANAGKGDPSDGDAAQVGG